MAFEIKNICYKCKHKWTGYGWKGYYSDRCPKCGAHTPGYKAINFLIGFGALCILGLIVGGEKDMPKSDPKPVQVEQQTVQENKELPDYVRNGKLVWEIPVCRMADDYSEYLHAVVNKDYETTRIYEKKHLCFMLKSGVKISVLDWNLIKPTKIRAYKDGDMLDLYTSAQFVKGAD